MKNKKLYPDEEVCLIYCMCRLPEPEDGSKMVQCDGCTIIIIIIIIINTRAGSILILPRGMSCT